MLLKPENYGLLFNYYFGTGTPIPMADSDCSWYHKSIYNDLYYNDFITLFNIIFRGGAKSTHANMGYPFALKQSEIAKFFLTVGRMKSGLRCCCKTFRCNLNATTLLLKISECRKAMEVGLTGNSRQPTGVRLWLWGLISLFGDCV